MRLALFAHPGGAEATGGELVCFRIRTIPGEEMTLAHDLVTDRWLKR